MREAGSSSYSHFGAGDQYNAPHGNIYVNSLENVERRKNGLLCKLKKSPYKDRKDRNPLPSGGTCEWFERNKSFQDWQNSESSAILVVSADPGCGKSVLAKHLVDHVLPTTTTRTTCYFFFKDDFGDQKSSKGALCCLLHQLFVQKSGLFSDKILRQFEADRDNLTTSFAELWGILVSATEDAEAGEVVCILDAFDECDDDEMLQLCEALTTWARSQSKSSMKVILTTRPYPNILQRFQPHDNLKASVIYLSGEKGDVADEICRDIDTFINSRVQDIATRLELEQAERDRLLRQLKRAPNRTYLWASLTLDLINDDLDLDEAKITQVTTCLPKTVNEAYDRILSKSHNVEETQKLLHIVVAATEPLTLEEMNLAMTMQPHHKSYADFALNKKDKFENKIRHLCGLFVTVVENKIYLCHQTAKEFLVPNMQGPTRTPKPTALKWEYALHPSASHEVLARICIQLLLFSDFSTSPLRDFDKATEYAERHVFLSYAAKNWVTHFRSSAIKSDSVKASVLRLCSAPSCTCLTWFMVYWTSTQMPYPLYMSSLMIASYFGLDSAVRRYLEAEAKINETDYTNNRCALSWAAENGHSTTVKLLIQGGDGFWNSITSVFRDPVEVDQRDRHGRTPLSYAAFNGHTAVVKLLLATGRVNPNSKDGIKASPLTYAICGGHEEVEKLLSSDAKTASDAATARGTLLLAAVRMDRSHIVRRLLKDGKVDADARDEQGRTCLSYAVERGNGQIATLLIDEYGADVEAKDNQGRAPISHAAAHQDLSRITLMLLETYGADPNARDKDKRTLLSYAAECGNNNLLQYLVDQCKVDLDLRDVHGRTPLLHAAMNGHGACFGNLLLSSKVNPNTIDQNWRTALSFAAEKGSIYIVKWILRDSKSLVSEGDKTRRTPLSYACEKGHDDVVELLLSAGATRYGIDDNGLSPLNYASKNNHNDIVARFNRHEQMKISADRWLQPKTEDWYRNTFSDSFVTR